MKSVRPKKSLGQHFLTDESVAERIAATLDDCVGLPVIEVGPGMGVLTKWLLSKGHDLTVAEIDTESIAWLKANMKALSANRILEQDFLKLNLNEFSGGRDIAVTGNYPYNISSQIFFHVLEYKDIVKECSGMLQKEVAERLAAPAGTKARGILSVLLQAWYDIEYLFTVDETVFHPMPKVKSGVIKMKRNSIDNLGCNETAFKTVVKTTFLQRRKALRNSVKPLLKPGQTLSEEWAELLSKRPEQLSVEEFVKLTKAITEKQEP